MDNIKQQMDFLTKSTKETFLKGESFDDWFARKYGSQLDANNIKEMSDVDKEYILNSHDCKAEMSYGEDSCDVCVWLRDNNDYEPNDE